MTYTKEENCIGCLNIKMESFPFYEGSIDMEGCGIDLNGKSIDDLIIFYCPVCGEKL